MAGMKRGARRAASLAVPLLCVLVAACSSVPNQEAALNASQNGDPQTAVRLGNAEVARFSTPEQCSRRTNLNCGTLALAYGALAEYQIQGGDRAGGESSFASAKGALGMMRATERPSATGMVYHDVSEAFWKAGDQARAKAVVEEGRAAGGDSWLMSGSAGQALLEERQNARRQAQAEAQAEAEADETNAGAVPPSSPRLPSSPRPPSSPR